MRAFGLALTFALLLAGCADSAPPAEQDDGFDDIPLEADDKTGVIRGVVVDGTYAPVAEAVVTLKISGAEQQTTGDLEGRFGFSNVPPGVHFLTATAPLHTEVQFSATVVAGETHPDVVTVQIDQIYAGNPFMTPIKQDGFFQCSQAGMPGYVYSSSPCHSFFVVNLDDYGYELDQNRDFHADVGAGWQTQVFEMTWESTAQGTSDQMGVTFSTYKPERAGTHWYASAQSGNPMRLQFDVGVAHETAQEAGGPEGPIPAEGMKDMSYFISVRPTADAVCNPPILIQWCVPPGLAVDQSFTTYLHQFYYLPAPEGWAIMNGDEDPFQ